MIAIGVGIGAFVAGVIFGDKIKAYFNAKIAEVKAKV